MNPVLKRFEIRVEEMRWYRFGYIGPEIGKDTIEYGGATLILAEVRVRPTTDAERAEGPGRDCETVAFLTWKLLLDDPPDALPAPKPGG